jgi:hypothetical protein
LSLICNCSDLMCKNQTAMRRDWSLITISQ